MLPWSSALSFYIAFVSGLYTIIYLSDICMFQGLNLKYYDGIGYINN